MHDVWGDGRVPCQSEPELWFAEQPAALEHAKRRCLDCPVRTLCLDGATQRRERWGVWGGEVFVDGVAVAHKRGRGRPRKYAQVA